jgi:hypothetical protein
VFFVCPFLSNFAAQQNINDKEEIMANVAEVENKNIFR